MSEDLCKDVIRIYLHLPNSDTYYFLQFYLGLLSILGNFVSIIFVGFISYLSLKVA